jgi:hypothetical protein
MASTRQKQTLMWRERKKVQNGKIENVKIDYSIFSLAPLIGAHLGHTLFHSGTIRMEWHKSVTLKVL